MEFDSLKAAGYNMNPGMDYVSGSTTSATIERLDGGFSKVAKAEYAQNLKELGYEVAESMKNQLKGYEDNISNEFFDKFVQEANKKLLASGRQFSYSLHEATNRVSIKIIDSKTKEVIREVPPEKALDAAAKMMELVGVMFDEKA